MNVHYGQDPNMPGPYRQQEPSVQYIPPVVIEGYVNQWIQTFIPGYGRVIAYVLDYNRRTGMVSMFIYQPPFYRRQYVQVYHGDLVGVSPYFGPTPPRPGGQPPRPRPPYGPGGPGHGGGFWPWLFGQVF
ncbi:hypothetical protein SAMN05192534_11027 [Alteribacillus persepolensis]|uniref:Uncharacterized protein n=1 Tax=Alteribacillus persepolensis TaxID=568899 RepID=A0A1G8ER10_9BACI|nr:hypothetical protein [Alteribacillus persepolensis]SDH72247.1 hypothetical protein SAMN05192534_11027 [Alteribacillus persepolensis]